jgi:hypothetical protein
LLGLYHECHRVVWVLYHCVWNRTDHVAKLFAPWCTWGLQCFFFPKPTITKLRSGMADYVISLTTMYDIIFWRWLHTHNSDHKLYWTWFFQVFIESTTPDLRGNGMVLPLLIMLGLEDRLPPLWGV